MLECQCHRPALACCGGGVKQVVRVVIRLGHIQVRCRVGNVRRDVRIVGGESHRLRLAQVFPIERIAVVGLVSDVFVTVCRGCGISGKSVHTPFVGSLERACAVGIELRRACLHSLYAGGDVYCAFGQGVAARHVVVVASRQCQRGQQGGGDEFCYFHVNTYFIVSNTIKLFLSA